MSIHTKMQRLIIWFFEMGVNYFLFKSPQSRLIVNNFLLNIEQKHDTQKNKCFNKMKIKKINSLKQLKELVVNSTNLQIKETSNNIVFGDGNPNADVMLIGEAPGFNEDRRGIPFCGQSGILLNNALKVINLDRSKCYITNVVYWRPPGNRRPNNVEIQTCKIYIEKQIQLIMPKVLILIGSVAVESLLNLNTPMNKLRKQSFSYSNFFLVNKIKTFVIFHPSYILRNLYQKKNMYYDLIKIINYINSI